MSDVTTILLMLAIIMFVPGFSIFHLRRLHQRCDDIATGVVNDRPISLRYRWLLLYNDYTGVGFGIGGIDLVGALVFFVLGRAAGSEDVKIVAYLCAAGLAWGALITMVFVVSWILHLRSVLRQAEAD